ncbi:hypothetical protein ACF0H5_008111 [Mactra antiquata]
MLDIEDDEIENHPHHLPPLTPRSLVTSQPRIMASPRVHAQRSFVSQNTNEEPRRTLAQVSRGHRDWTSGLCSACTTDRRLCCYVSCCAPLVTWTLAERMNEPSACAVACLPGMLSAMRTKLRSIGGIQGSILTDCCLSLWCPWCVVCQMSQEVDKMIIQAEIYVKPIK